MPWGERSTQDLNSQLLSGIDGSVRQKSEVFTNQIRELCAVLETLANLLQSERMDRKRKEDPNAPKNWSVADWKSFWQGYDPRWGQEIVNIPANHPALLELQVENQNLGTAMGKLKLQVKHAEGIQKDLADQLRQYRIAEKQAQEEKLRKKDAAIPDRYREVVLQARALPEKIPQEKYKNELMKPPQRWPRKYRMLYVIAQTGWASRLELDHVLGLIEEVSPKNGSIKRILGELLIPGFLEQAIVSFTKDEKITSLVIVRLATKGISLCDTFGWEVAESEWDILQSEPEFREKFSQLHALNVLH